jgi:hypothetical protein
MEEAPANAAWPPDFVANWQDVARSVSTANETWIALSGVKRQVGVMAACC